MPYRSHGPIDDPAPIVTSDREEAEARLSGLFSPHRLDVVSGSLAVTARTLRLPSMTIVDITHGAEVEVTPGKLSSYYHVNAVLEGHVRSVCGPEIGVTGTGMAAVLSPDQSSAMRWGRDCRQLAVKIDRRVVERELAAALGREPDAPLVFRMTMATGAGAGLSWMGTLLHLVRDVQETPDLALPGTVVRHLQGLVAAKLIYGQPNNYTEELTSRRQPVHPRRVQRALDLIHEQPGAHLTSADLAEAAGTNVRSLQQAFREHLGVSPMAYLRSVRLTGAHDQLVAAAPDDGVTVTSVAHAWGFVHVSRFAHEYRKRFGEPPSTTLRG